MATLLELIKIKELYNAAPISNGHEIMAILDTIIAEQGKTEEAVRGCMYHAETLKTTMEGGFSKEEQMLMLQNVFTAIEDAGKTLTPQPPAGQVELPMSDHDEDCHINNWGDNQIPECTCGYTSEQGALCDILEALPPELRDK